MKNNNLKALSTEGINPYLLLLYWYKEI